MMSSWGSCPKRELTERCEMSWDLLGIGTERKMGEVEMDHGKNREARRWLVTPISIECQMESIAVINKVP